MMNSKLFILTAIFLVVGCQAPQDKDFSSDAETSANPVRMQKHFSVLLGDAIVAMVEDNSGIQWLFTSINADLPKLCGELNHVKVEISDFVYQDTTQGTAVWRYLDAESLPTAIVQPRTATSTAVSIEAELHQPFLHRPRGENEIKEVMVLYRLIFLGENGNSFTLQLDQNLRLQASE